MKFLPENKTKIIMLATAGGICVIGTIYFLFFFGRRPEVPQQDALTVDKEQAARQSEIMPYGPTFDSDIFEQDKFKALRPVSPIEVLPAELGHNNPFVR